MGGATEPSPVRSILLSLVVLLLAAGCGGGGGTELTTFRGDGFSVGVPPGWEGCRTRLAEVDALAAEFRGPRGEDAGLPVLQVANQGTARAFDHALRFHELLLQLSPGFAERADEEVDVDGAERARRLEFVQQGPAVGNAPSEELRGVSVLAEAPGGSVVSVILTAPTSEFGTMQAEFDAILASLSVSDPTGSSELDALQDCR